MPSTFWESDGLAAWVERNLRETGFVVPLGLLVLLFGATILVHWRRRVRKARLRAALLSTLDGDEQPLMELAARGAVDVPFAQAVRHRMERWKDQVRSLEHRPTQAPDGEGVQRRLAQLPVPCFSLGTARKVTEANREACRLFGRKPGDLVGREFPEIMRSREASPADARLAKLMPVGFRGDACLEVLRPDGSSVPILMWGRPAGTSDADPKVELCIALDVSRFVEVDPVQAVSDRHSQENVLDAMGKLAAGVAHDFNNYLTAILGHALILKQREGDEAAGTNHADEICKAADTARNLTRELSAFSRTQVAYPERVEVNEVLLGMKNELDIMTGPKVRLDMQLGAASGETRIDRSQLEEILHLLVRNARGAIEGTGTIRLQSDLLSENGDWIRVRVIDDGQGMTAEECRHAFEPYFTSRRDSLGAGMGLASVHGMVTQNSGRIAITSKPDRGTAVEIRLPLAGAEGGNLSSSARDMLTVCVIESDIQIRRLISTILDREGFRVLSAADGDEGFEVCMRRGKEIDLVLTDVHMPNHDAERFAREITSQFPDISVLHMSGGKELPFVEAGGSVVGFLQKPFSPGELVEAVRQSLPGGPQTKGRKVRVLVVDDEEPVRVMLRSLLNGLGYECTDVADGDAALDELGRIGYDVVVTDMILPDKDGIIICSEIRRRFPDVKIIAMSGRAGGSAGMAAALELGAVSTLSKPFSMDELELALNLAIG